MDKQALQESREYHRRRDQSRREALEQERLKKQRQVTAAIRHLAPKFTALRAVYLFGSLVRPGNYKRGSDIDVAVMCDDVAEESRFWRALETELECDVDLRTYRGAVAWAVDTYGACVYERKVSDTGTVHST